MIFDRHVGIEDSGPLPEIGSVCRSRRFFTA
jgi:hypothetical protein